jgi:hypothetical protein
VHPVVAPSPINLLHSKLDRRLEPLFTIIVSYDWRCECTTCTLLTQFGVFTMRSALTNIFRYSHLAILRLLERLVQVFSHQSLPYGFGLWGFLD